MLWNGRRKKIENILHIFPNFGPSFSSVFFTSHTQTPLVNCLQSQRKRHSSMMQLLHHLPPLSPRPRQLRCRGCEFGFVFCVAFFLFFFKHKSSKCLKASFLWYKIGVSSWHTRPARALQSQLGTEAARKAEAEQTQVRSQHLVAMGQSGAAAPCLNSAARPLGGNIMLHNPQRRCQCLY